MSEFLQDPLKLEIWKINYFFIKVKLNQKMYLYNGILQNKIHSYIEVKLHSY